MTKEPRQIGICKSLIVGVLKLTQSLEAIMIDIRPLPAFDDNYIWLITEPPGRNAVVVDPGDADPVIETLESEGLTLTAVLVTHHHGDHVGGLAELIERWPGIRIHGPDDRRIRRLTDRHRDGERIRPRGLDTGLEVWEIPGHTASHIGFLAEGALFCGDTLFACGCGRVFDGTFEQLAASLRRIAALPPDTRCYCAHEYTLANLGFARWVEPESAALLRREQAARAMRSAGRPTVPSLLSLELATNPFLRTGEPTVVAAARHWAGRPLDGPTEVFTALRQWKDRDYD